MGSPKRGCVYVDERESVICAKRQCEEQKMEKQIYEAARVLIGEVARLPTVSLWYDGVYIKARVDSCAGRSIIGGKLAKKVKKQPARNVAVVKGVCGTLIPIKYQARVS